MLSDDTVRRVAAARLPGVLQPPPIYFAPWRSARQLFYVRIFRGGSRRYARTSVQVQPHGTRRSAGAGQIESHFCQNVEMEFWRSQERRLRRSLAPKCRERRLPQRGFVSTSSDTSVCGRIFVAPLNAEMDLSLTVILFTTVHDGDPAFLPQSTPS